MDLNKDPFEGIENITEYEAERLNNEAAFTQLVKATRPEIFVLMDTLDRTGVDPSILWHIIHQLDKIANGTKYGSVLATIENGTVTFIRGEESNRINTPILKGK